MPILDVGTIVELRVIAVGQDADLTFLRYLTRPGEVVARPESLEDLRALFRREISGVVSSCWGISNGSP